MPVTWVRVSAAWGQDTYSDTTGTCLPAYLAGSANATAAPGHHASISAIASVRHCYLTLPKSSIAMMQSALRYTVTKPNMAHTHVLKRGHTGCLQPPLFTCAHAEVHSAALASRRLKRR